MSGPRRTNASRIAEIRLKRGITQGELAMMIGAKQSQVAGWETGYRKPKLEALSRIARALGCELDELIDLE